MNVVSQSKRDVRVQKSHLDVQFPLLFLVLAVSLVITRATVTEGFWRTLILLCGIAFVGLLLIIRLSWQLTDPNMQKLGYVFLLKLLLVLLLVRFGWMPQLELYSATWGGDPARYYYMAQNLGRAGLSLLAVQGLNYTGILFYYGLVFAVFGFNHLVPALINTFVTLLATLLLVRIGYKIKRRRSPWDWTLGLCMIVPEVLWYDVITSRETLTMSLIVISVLSLAWYFMRNSGDRFSA